MKVRIPTSKFQRDFKVQAPIRDLKFEAWSFSGIWRLELGAFTLLELLTVIAIIGILAAIALPSLRALRPNVQAAAARQLLDDINRARQLAISQRTTVFMIFVPQGYWTSNQYANLTAVEQAKADRL